jgi:hypothetical protein
MDVVAAATMDSEGTLAATAPDSPHSHHRSPTDFREAKSKAAKKLLSKDEEGVKAVKHRGRCKNVKERNAPAAAGGQVQAAAQMAWQMRLKSGAHVGLHPSIHPSLA